jgi:hypothetical protein
MKKIVYGTLTTLICAAAVLGMMYVSDSLSEKEDLSLSAFAKVQSGVPATVVTFKASEVGDNIEARQVEGTNYTRIIPVVIDGEYGTSEAYIDERCAIPAPGSRVTVEISYKNSRGRFLGYKLNEFSGVHVQLECKF